MTLLSSYEVSTSTLSELSVWLSQKASNAAVKKGKRKRKRKKKYSWLVFSWWIEEREEKRKESWRKENKDKGEVGGRGGRSRRKEQFMSVSSWSTDQCRRKTGGGERRWREEDRCKQRNKEVKRGEEIIHIRLFSVLLPDWGGWKRRRRRRREGGRTQHLFPADGRVGGGGAELRPERVRYSCHFLPISPCHPNKGPGPEGQWGQMDQAAERRSSRSQVRSWCPGTPPS